MRKATTFVLALLFAFATMGVVADDVFARGGGSSGGGGATGGPSGGGTGGGTAGATGDAGIAGDPDGPRTVIDAGVLALPRFGSVVTGCTTTNFGAAGGTTPCPINR